MSDKKLSSFIFVDSASRVTVFCKRTIAIDLSLEIQGVEVFQIISKEPVLFPEGLGHVFDPAKGFGALGTELSNSEQQRLLLLSRKIEILSILNTNIQLLIGVLNARFTSAFADSIPVSPGSYRLLRRFLDDERDLLLCRSERQLKSLCVSVMQLQSVGEVEAFYKDFSAHYVIGDYAASSRGLR